jgi:nuclear pore complex protein Nup54
MNKQEAPSMLSSLQTNTSIKKQLEQINVISLYPLVGLNDDQIKQYLDMPPQSINPILWEQAKRNNPNAKKLLPVPIVGFKGTLS